MHFASSCTIFKYAYFGVVSIMVLLEDCIDLVAIMKANGLQTPNSALPSSHEQDAAVLRRKRAVPDEVLDEMGYILAPWRFLTSPLLSGEENLPNPAAETCIFLLYLALALILICDRGISVNNENGEDPIMKNLWTDLKMTRRTIGSLDSSCP
eukprot:Gb_25177 [translate_table: standard]